MLPAIGVGRKTARRIDHESAAPLVSFAVFCSRKLKHSLIY